MKKLRFYLDKDEEEKWLNEMANNGWAFKSFCLGVYSFEKCELGEYEYKIDLLKDLNKEGRDYKEFLNEMNVEIVDQWFYWVFLRKKTEDGVFELYSDTESKVESYERILKFLKPLFVLEIIGFLYELIGFLLLKSTVLAVCAVIIGFVILCSLKVIWKFRWKVQLLMEQL